MVGDGVSNFLLIFKNSGQRRGRRFSTCDSGLGSRIASARLSSRKFSISLPGSSASTAWIVITWITIIDSNQNHEDLFLINRKWIFIDNIHLNKIFLLDWVYKAAIGSPMAPVYWRFFDFHGFFQTIWYHFDHFHITCPSQCWCNWRSAWHCNMQMRYKG